MAKAIRWKVPFKSLKGTSYTVNIYEEGWTGAATNLIAAANPFVINEDSNDNYFTPVRSSTGHLRIIDDGRLSEDIFSTSAIQHYVELVDSSNNVYWIGFLAPETFTQEWGPKPMELELPVVSLLETLKGYYLDTTIASKSIKSIIKEGLDKIGAYPKGLHEPRLISDNSCLDFCVSTLGWITINEYDKDDQNWEKYTPKTYYEFIEDVCRFWGYTLREYNGEFWLCATDATSSYLHYDSQDFTDFISGLYNQPTIETASIDDILDYSVLDGHKVSIMQGAKKVSVIGDFGATDQILKVPDFTRLKNGSKVRLGTQMQRLVFPDGIGVRQWQNWYSPTELTLIYDNIAGINDSAHSDSGYPWNESIIWLNTNQGAKGGCLLRLQDWDGTETPDSVNLADTICLKNMENEVCVVLFSEYITITEGCLVLNGSVKHLNSTITSGHLKMRLKCGSKYYNGTSWQSTAATFNVSFDSNGIVNTNTYDSDYDGAKGYIIPLSDLTGRIELSLYGSQIDNITLIQNFKVTHYHLATSIYNGIERDKNQYIERMNNGFVNEVEVNNKIATFDKNKMGTKFLLYPSGLSVVRQFDWIDGNNKLPEERLLARLKTWYNRTCRKIDVKIVNNRTYKPIDTLTDELGNDTYGVCTSIDYRNDELNITLEG